MNDPTLQDATISAAVANLVALLAFPASLVLFLVPYAIIWGDLARSLQSLFSGTTGWWLLLSLAAGILVHELLHLAGFLWWGRVPRKAVRLGFAWRALAPYAHCSASVPASAYRRTLLLPGLLLGLVPVLAGLVAGWLGLVLWGIVMIVAAGGDLAVFLAIRWVPGSTQVLDHPRAIGCQIIKEDV